MSKFNFLVISNNGDGTTSVDYRDCPEAQKLEAIQNAVGGAVESIGQHVGTDLCYLVNETGLLHGLPPNMRLRTAQALCQPDGGTASHIDVMGNLVICGTDKRGELRSLDEQTAAPIMMRGIPPECLGVARPADHGPSAGTRRNAALSDAIAQALRN